MWLQLLIITKERGEKIEKKLTCKMEIKGFTFQVSHQKKVALICMCRIVYVG